MSAYSILVTSSPYDQAGSASAVRFCQHLLEEGHTLSQVFFYQQGIYNAFSTMAPPNDERNRFEEWKALHDACGTPLRVCITAGEKRGLVLSTDANQPELAHPFEQTGLGEFFTALHDSHRLVQF
ncbi:sulfurtransferase complex subunit TusD [Alteromonas sp. C1M14]|uniref:sulfurtransferase complex subunit TusD n=1 Tax=Alteromonas sp. C1M14 TaxID=2841567 RepID=UPI001C092C1F|nr:sulfurtransferase complex subunit TusD [Alteromonas sp. C1M14]MBU2976828.1 sulfurtransferase complex subunit TusD [Alteromonas sp. C1M14]